MRYSNAERVDHVMKRNSLRAVAAVLVVLLLLPLCACSSEFVGEEKAKEAGLALLRQAFGVRETSVHVEYFERAGTNVIDNSEISANEQSPDQLYLVTISDQTLGVDLYYAEVDAKTGVAYYASMSGWNLIRPQNENTKQANQDDAQSDEANTAAQEPTAQQTAGKLSIRKYTKEISLVSARGCCKRESACFSSVGIGYFVTLADGALYRVGYTWPEIVLDEMQAKNTESKGERP